MFEFTKKNVPGRGEEAYSVEEVLHYHCYFKCVWVFTIIFCLTGIIIGNFKKYKFELNVFFQTDK